LYEFGPFRLYPDQRLFFRLEERLEVDRKALAILEVLVRNKGQLVTKERLLNEVWGDVAVEDGNIGVQLSKIRKALGDDRRQAQFIETVHGEGYRFIADVAERNEELYPEESKRIRYWSLALLTVVVLGLVAALLWSRRYHTRSVGPAALSTVSPDARSRYELALKYESEGDDEQALATLDEATALDKDFADAYLRAAFIANQIGEEDEALEYLTKTKNCGGTRTEHQRLQIDALEGELTRSYQTAMAKYRLLLDAYPDDPTAWYYFADYAMQSRKGFSEARQALEHCLRLDPANPYCEFDRMTLYVLSNDFDKAIALYDSLRPSLHYPWLDEPFGLALYGKGEMDKARNLLGNFSKRAGTHGLTGFTTGREWLADMNLFQGKIAEASSEIKVLLPSDSQYGIATHHLYLARVNTLISNESKARDFALEAVSQVGTRDTRIEAAAILACAGRLRNADRVLHLGNGHSIDDLIPSTKHFIDGCKALSKGDYNSAIRELQASYDIGDDLDTEFFLARAYIGARRWNDAKAVLKDLESSKGRIIADQSNPPVIWALAHYYLGVVFEESADKEEAIGYYSKFLDIWKAGDPNLKAIVDAKKRLAQLRGSNSPGNNT